jgi:hypothetical protein
MMGQEDLVRCARCQTEHELLEPAFGRPDDVAAMSAEERGKWVADGDDRCRIEPHGDLRSPRCFVRTVLPVQLTDVDDYTQWGLWVEVEETHARRMAELWNEPSQGAEAPFPGRLANQIPGYECTINLPVMVQLTGLTTRPSASFDASTAHLFVEQCRAGVTSERVLEWLRRFGYEDDCSGGEITEGWPFDQAKNVATISSKAVVIAGCPVLLVIHYSDDDSWAFLEGDEFSIDTGLVVSMAHAVERDPTLFEIADLPPGWVARRECVGGMWTREADPEM